MADNFFYVYALKDPTSSPALPFYIGKWSSPDFVNTFEKVLGIASFVSGDTQPNLAICCSYSAECFALDMLIKT